MIKLDSRCLQLDLDFAGGSRKHFTDHDQTENLRCLNYRDPSVLHVSTPRVSDAGTFP
jgi:hypothetical protein